MRQRMHISVTILALLCLARVAQAQQDDDYDAWVKKHDHDCKMAIHFATKGKPDKKYAEAIALLPECGADGATAIGTVVAGTAAITDTSLLVLIHDPLLALADGAIIQAQTAMAANTTAANEPRVYSIRYLLSMLSPEVGIDYGALVKGKTTTTTAESIIIKPGCQPIGSDGHGMRAGSSPLPAGYEATVRTILRSVAAAPATPTPVKNAALCVELMSP